MPVIICDTGPLVALSSLGLLEIVSRLYTPLVTRAVLDEWMARDGRPDLSSAFEIIDVATPDPLLAVQLDPGEASVIQGAMERTCKRVLLDERKARKVARRVFGLETIGTAGVLVQARRQGLTPELGPLFAQLRQQKYWIDDKIVSWALQEAP
jgi:predicted nucleic acid-binding protein